MNLTGTCLLVLALIVCCTIPVSGVTTYLSDGPQMSAEVTGTNEFFPGEDAIIRITVANNGLNSMKTSWAGGSDPAAAVTRPDLSREYYDWQGSGTISRDDVPTTAKEVNVALSPGNAPVVVKNGPQDIGDMASQQTAMVTIAAKITSDATEGEYTLPLTIQYTYLSSSSQVQSAILESDYRRVNVTVPLTLKIKPTVKIEVLEAVPENLGSGMEGYLNLTIRNDGFGNGKKATVALVRNGNSPIIPMDSSVYIGDFPVNTTVTCRYRVAIASGVKKQTYPVDIAVSYENRDGETVTSAYETIGIPVSEKLPFLIIPDSIRVDPGSDQVITVRYRNPGTRTAYGAQARLFVVEPFTSADTIAYLGDLKPGDIAEASYRISTESGAKAQDYQLDTEIRFRDEQDTSQVSDILTVTVRVNPSSQTTGSAAFLPVVILAVLVTGAGYYLLVTRKKK